MTNHVRLIETRELYWDGCDLLFLQKEINDLITKEGDLCTVTIEQDDYNDHYSIFLKVNRMETDVEKTKREKLEAERIERGRIYRHNTYLTLKKEFND